MQGLRVGNAPRDGAARRGWILGHFLEEDPARRSDAVEVKWGVHRRGDRNEAFVANQAAHTLSVLIRGRFRLFFRAGGATREVLLEHEGDYALWQPGVEHHWHAEEDCVIFTVRWPSLPNDQGRGPGGGGQG